MEENNKEERPLMDLETFKNYIISNNKKILLRSFIGVSAFKSVWRAIRRGHVTNDGFIIPHRPFNNRSLRRSNEIRKSIYGQLKQYQQRASC